MNKTVREISEESFLDNKIINEKVEFDTPDFEVDAPRYRIENTHSEMGHMIIEEGGCDLIIELPTYDDYLLLPGGFGDNMERGNKERENMTFPVVLGERLCIRWGELLPDDGGISGFRKRVLSNISSVEEARKIGRGEMYKYLKMWEDYWEDKRKREEEFSENLAKDE